MFGAAGSAKESGEKDQRGAKSKRGRDGGCWRFLVAWKGCGGSNGGRKRWLLQVVGGLEGMLSKQGLKETVAEGSATAWNRSAVTRSDPNM